MDKKTIHTLKQVLGFVVFVIIVHMISVVVYASLVYKLSNNEFPLIEILYFILLAIYIIALAWNWD